MYSLPGPLHHGHFLVLSPFAVNPKETYVKAEVSVNEKGRVLSTDKDEKGKTSEQVRFARVLYTGRSTA